jgi:2,4-dienoyl-CoA reductase-like NADH-dependent reductase (Old Yellow Enzyme family)/pyruvate/2-oxoglutarate dehydrogenase complex dihydrolipoamide dehydrogenase (E3) component
MASLRGNAGVSAMSSDGAGAATAFPSLFSPISIGPVTLRNRTVFQPHFTALGGIDGMPTDDLAAYHEERAIGGVGLIVTESQAIHPTGKMSRRFLNAWDPAVVPGLAKVASGVHDHGAKIFAQLTHGGHTSLEHPPHVMWAPTQMPEPSSHFNTKALDDDDIQAVISGFAAAARNALDAGFDGIEIKIAHDGLLRSFAAPFFNRRTDRYGGSFENRMRLSFEVIEAIKRVIGSAPLGVRICLDEFTAFGYDLEYGLQMARALEATSAIDYFNSDAGSFSSYWMEIPPAAVAPEAFERLNRALKAATTLPVVAFGRIGPTQRAEAMVKAGEADLIGWARQLIADPQTVNKLAVGRPDLIRPCIACNDGCVHQVGQEKGIRCIHNPGAGRELTHNERLVGKTPTPRRLVIVGGGPAGLKTAEVAARRGHSVTVLERTRQLGGQVMLAALQPEHAVIGEVISYLENQLAEGNVEIRRGIAATAPIVAEMKPDIVVLANGSEPNLPNRIEDGSIEARRLGRQILPDIEGLDLPFVISADEVLSGVAKPAGKVVVIDETGHWEAAGTAEFLADAGCAVVVVASHGAVASELEAGARTLFQRRAAIKGIELRPNFVVTAIAERRVQISALFSSGDSAGWGKYVLIPGDERWIEDVDWVVAVVGRRSREDLFLALKSAPELAGVRIERVGDCVAPRLLQSVILEAFTFAAAL